MKLILCVVFCLSLGFISCTSDEKVTKENASEVLVAEARSFLTGDIVLNTHATMNSVNKTLLKTGCPTKFKFEWSDTNTNICTISLLNFTVGNMGMIINFECAVQTMQLNTWEKDEYKEDGWFKFYGKDGNVFGEDTDSGEKSSAKGSSVKGYYNADTHEINFIVDYNMMNVRSECFLQTVDKSLLANYDALKAQYEIDLAEAKKEQGKK